MATMAPSPPPTKEAPCVKGIKQLLDEGLDHIPEFYLLPAHNRPCLSQVYSSDQPPIIDLATLHGHGRSHTLIALAKACHEWGIFQVINHGVPQSLVEGMFLASRAFFQLPAEERMRWFSDDSSQGNVVYIPIFGRDWDDALVFRSTGNEDQSFENAPEICREEIAKFYKAMAEFGTRTCQALSESLGLEPDRLRQAGVQHLTYCKLHYYSPCPEPSLAFGKIEHTDPNFFTCILQDDIGGLQVLKDDCWVAIEPRPDAILVNIADMMEILTNGRFKSVLHRVIANKERPRSSIACFVGAEKTDIIAPLPELINDQNPPIYRETPVSDLYAVFSKDPTGKFALRHFSLQP